MSDKMRHIGLPMLAVCLASIELIVLELIASFCPTISELPVILLTAATGSIILATPFLCLRLWGVTRKITIAAGATAACSLVLLGAIHGDFDIGHAASFPGWTIGTVFGLWLLIVSPIAALIVKDKQMDVK